MRLVSWNCAGGFAKKQAALVALDPDLAVVCEIREREANAFADAQVLWTGRPDAKGMAIVGRNGWKIEPIAEGSQAHVLAVRASRAGSSVTLVGVWTLQAEGSYVRPVITALDELSEYLSGDVILAGDFNANPVFKGKPRFDDARLRLLDRGLESLWHVRSGEAHGAEQTATLYWTWNRDRPFHVDYVFATPGLRARCKAFRIGSFEDWVEAKISDHVPLIAEFEVA